jgi:ABC-type glutathione transport system ATPase component
MALLGLLPGDAVVTGGATFEGQKLLRGGAAARLRGRRVSLVTQAAMNALNPAYTVHAQVAEAAALTMPAEVAGRRATELLGDVGIPASAHGAYPHELSGGMRQRVVIAMALANSPDLLIADEPTTGLDLVTQASILRLLQDLKERMGLTVLVITHDVQMVLRFADELIVLKDGAVVERGTESTLVDDYSRRLLNTRLSTLRVLS